MRTLIFISMFSCSALADHNIPHDDCNVWEEADIFRQPLCGPCFLRGDVNNDNHHVDLTDAILILEHLFEGNQDLCLEPADVDNNDVLDVTDPIVLLDFLFNGGSAPGGGEGWPRLERSCWCFPQTFGNITTFCCQRDG